MKIAIVLATYNPSPAFFEQQIHSLINQTWADWECFISDQSDQSLGDSFKKAIGLDPRIKMVQIPSQKKGAFYNFENGLSAVPTSFEWIAFCDQDDVWEPEKLEKMIDYIHKHPETTLVHSDLSLIDEENNFIGASCWEAEDRQLKNSTLLDLVLRNQVTGCACMFKRELLKFALPFPANVSNEYLHDHWLALWAVHTGSIGIINEPLIRYRQHSNNVIGAQLKKRNSFLKKIQNLAQLKQKSSKALKSRQKIANDFIQRLLDLGQQDTLAKTELKPVLEGNTSEFLKLLLQNLRHPYEVRLLIQLTVGSALRLHARDQ